MGTETSDEIWNRAATERGGSAPGPGDAALSSALAFHNMVMSGGVDHAFDVLTHEEISAAAGGYRYLRLDQIADLIDRAKTTVDSADEGAIQEIDDEYSELIPQDRTLLEHFEAALQRNPEDFSDVS